MQCLPLMWCAEVESTIREEGCTGGHKILVTRTTLEHPGHGGKVVVAMEKGDPTLGRIEVQRHRLILKPLDIEAYIRSKKGCCI